MGGGSLSSGNPWLITQAGKNSGLVRPTTFLRPQRFCAERGKERWRGSVSGDPRTPATIPAALWVGDYPPPKPWPCHCRVSAPSTTAAHLVHNFWWPRLDLKI